MLKLKMNEQGERERGEKRVQRRSKGRKEVLMGERLEALRILIALEGRTGMAGRILS